MIVVADTSPPLHLGRIGRLDFLRVVVGRVTVPRTVWNELLHLVAGARRAGALERAAPVVAELRADGFWLADALVLEFLRALGETP